jgi:hypothetical protein
METFLDDGGRTPKSEKRLDSESAASDVDFFVGKEICPCIEESAVFRR